MPIGLTNALATFQALMNLVLKKHLDQFILAYLNNILIYLETLKEYKGHVRTVLKKL